MKGRHTQANKRAKGFTLVELIVVIAIIGVLTSILVPSMIGYVRKAKRASDIAAAKVIYQNILSLYAMNEEAWASFNKIVNGSGGNEHWYAYDWETNEKYNLVAVAQLAGVDHARSGRTYYVWRATQTESEDFCGWINYDSDWTSSPEYDLSNNVYARKSKTPIPMKLRQSNLTGKYLDEWVLCLNQETKDLEVWAADSSLAWNSTYKGYIVYRLWPNPDPAYN